MFKVNLGSGSGFGLNGGGLYSGIKGAVYLSILSIFAVGMFTILSRQSDS